ncbi:MAG: dienelactone hydrolase family protein [Planctomycetes bacterium]|nr:dienelactone hydrolase family protein [Planctomycetota bacterium]MCB9911324.1 dienelactone hydrolase family protein [Planctomycetota bacterium]MCB9912197.1 dienelactone hydrolase family protein [Planctomycetota bacterium]
MNEQPVQIQARNAPVDWVSGLWNLPEGEVSQTAILLAHGAGVGMQSPFMEGVARTLAQAGFPVLRFQYAYAERMQREGTRRPPDRKPMLLSVHRHALKALRKRFPDARIVLAGKSMGARMSSYLAAEGEDVAGLVYFGYPLHPAGKPDRLRTDAFPAIAQPSLFLQGTRDALCDLELLRPALATYGGPVQLEVLEGADHGFQVLKSHPQTEVEVFEDLLARCVRWLQAL